MLRYRFTTDAQPRWKNGQPPHSTTGVASASSTQFLAGPGIIRPRGLPGSISETMNSRMGSVASAETKNRLVMSSSSGLRSSTLTTRGSRAMPQIGQEPGSSRTISGCIGQVHSVRVGAIASTGSSAIPHFGQLPGPS